MELEEFDWVCIPDELETGIVSKVEQLSCDVLVDVERVLKQFDLDAVEKLPFHQRREEDGYLYILTSWKSRWYVDKKNKKRKFFPSITPHFVQKRKLRLQASKILEGGHLGERDIIFERVNGVILKGRP